MPTLVSRADLWRIEQASGSHRVALRAGLSVLVPLWVLVANGHADWTPYASFGAFASLYGRAHAHLLRLQMQVSAGVMLTAAVVSGVLTGLLTQEPWLLIVTSAVIAGTAQIVAAAHGYHPPGPLFFVFAYGAVSAMPHTPGDIGVAAAVSGASAAFAVTVGVAGVLRRPGLLRQRWREASWLPLRFRPSVKPLLMAVGALIAGGLAAALHIGHPYWAMVAAIAPLTAPHVTSQVVRGAHRALGTLGGLLTSWAILSVPMGAVHLVAVGASLQVAAELLVGRNYGLAMLTITPLALVMGQIGAPRPLSELLFDRGVETLIGAAVGVTLAVAAHAADRRRSPSTDAGGDLDEAD